MVTLSIVYHLKFHFGFTRSSSLTKVPINLLKAENLTHNIQYTGVRSLTGQYCAVFYCTSTHNVVLIAKMSLGYTFNATLLARKLEN